MEQASPARALMSEALSSKISVLFTHRSADYTIMHDDFCSPQTHIAAALTVVQQVTLAGHSAIYGP